jgi:hypothetical protein
MKMIKPAAAGLCGSHCRFSHRGGPRWGDGRRQDAHGHDEGSRCQHETDRRDGEGRKRFDAAKVEEAANTIARHAGHIPKIFPEGSLDKPTEALPVIWTRWDDFTRIGKEMETSALALAEVAKTATTAKVILPQLGEVGKTCKSCHQDFRQAK